MVEVKEFRVSSLSSAAEQRRFAMTIVQWSSREQLEVEEEDVDRQEEEVEEKGEVESRRTHHVDGHGWRYEMRSELEP